MSLTKVINIIKKYQNFLITSHINPEGDSIGSQLSLLNLLNRLDKTVYIINEDPVPDSYKFLPVTDKVSTLIDKKYNFEVTIILDCPNLQRIGKVINLIDKDKIIVNIDHHISNENFGKVNWVDVGASSVGEMVYKIYEKIGCKIEKENALYLYVAILTDTGSFRYSNTASSTHRIVSRLLEYGLEPDKISEDVYDKKSLPATKLLGFALSNISISEDGGVAWIKLTNEMFKATGARPEETENFINFARAISGVKVAFLLMEKEGEIKVNFRSKGEINVNKIASAFGGGGHTKASGCKIKGQIDEVEKLVLDKVKKSYK